MTSINNPNTAAALRRRAKKKVRPIPMIISAAAVIGLGWWGWAKVHASQSSATVMITAPVTKGNLVETISATGSVTAQTGAEVKIGSQITGTIQHLYADVGSHVTAGQPIAVLDLPDVRDQMQEAKANMSQAVTKLQQLETGVSMLHTQLSSGVLQAQAQLRGGHAQLTSAFATLNQQKQQTNADITKAKSALSSTQAALNTARAADLQTRASANLQIANANEQLIQVRATADDANRNLVRQQQLIKQGYVPQSAVDNAVAASKVDNSLVTSGEQNVQLVKAQVTASLQTAADQVLEAQQNVSSAKAALAAAQAETYLNKSREANVKSAAAAVNQDNANLATASANTTQNLLKTQDIQQASQAVQSAQDQVHYWQAQVDKTIIRTPITGTVLQLASQQGETLAAGLAAPTLIIVANLHRLQIDAYVDETDIGKVKLGQEADCTLDAFPHKNIKGHVSKISSGATILQGVVTYDVTIKLDRQSTLLKPDMTANVTLQIGKLYNVLLVPSEAVHLGVHGSTVDLLKMENGKSVSIPVQVKTGGSDGVNTEIKSGLKEGEIIIRAGTASSNRPMWKANSPFQKNTKETAQKKS